MGLSLERVREVLGGRAFESGETQGDLWVKVKSEDLLAVVDLLRTHPELSFDWLADLCGVDYLPRHPRFEVVVHLYSMAHTHRIRVRCEVPEASLTVPSLTAIWQGANWLEREAYDMYGIRFQGHPNLERILNPLGTEGFPQRKDYPLRGPREPKEEL